MVLADLTNSIQDISKQLKYAMVFGSSVKHTRGQKVGLEHVLAVCLSCSLPLSFIASASTINTHTDAKHLTSGHRMKMSSQSSRIKTGSFASSV